MSEQHLYSTHTFLFPFQWNYKALNNTSFEKKTDLTVFTGLIEKTGDWRREKFDTDKVLWYNEANYFYDFVRDILYDTKTDTKNGFIANYVYDIPAEAWEYRITTNKKEYVLLIDSILLHLYNTGVGVLSFHLVNRSPEQQGFLDILRINQYGRRLYPPFFKMDDDIVGMQQQFHYANFPKALQGVKEYELAEAITVGPNWREDYSAYNSARKLSDGLFNPPVFIRELFRGIDLMAGSNKGGSNSICLSPLLDDRMFVVCWYGNDELANQFKSGSYTSSDWWYQFVFVDGESKTCQNAEMASDLIKKHTNGRWQNFGTFYGVSRYSFVCLTGRLSSGVPGFLVNHIQTMYYKMTELALVQRACLLRFSDEITEISSMETHDAQQLTELVSSLYRQYIRFVNKIYFREITPQEQGIELYDLLQKSMCIPDTVKDLDKEMEELHTYVAMQEDVKRNRDIAFLTRIGAVFVIPSFISGFLGMNLFQIQSGQPADTIFKSVLIILLMIALPAMFYFVYKNNYRITRKDITLAAIVMIVYAMLFALAYYIYIAPPHASLH